MSADPSALETLQAIFPSHSTAELTHILLASANQLERATTALLGDAPIVSATCSSSSSSLKRPREELKLDGWLKGSANKNLKANPPPPPAALAATRRVAPCSAPSAFSLLRSLPTSSSSLPSPNPPPAINLPPLTLSTPALIAQHTHGLITLIPNVLPQELASRLFKTMVEESEGKAGKEGWDRNRWYLFDREVESPHTTSFYVELPKPEADSKSTSYDPAAFAEAAHHWYNGEKRPARVFLPEMDEAKELIGSLVRTVLSERERHPLEWEGDWVPNVAAANCYRGAKESVGYHSDVLTYLGPYPTIASLSLGVSRPFRLRPFLPSSSSSNPAKTTNRTLEIPLTHNTLCIMHAGCQERFKHSVPPVSAMDLFRLPGERGKGDKAGRGYRERINMTFRHYRPDFAPLPTPGSSSSSSSTTTTRALPPPPAWATIPLPPPPPPPSTSNPTSKERTTSKSTYQGTPHCYCGAPTLLRPDAKGRARARARARLSSNTSSTAHGENQEEEEEEEEELLFFWTCAAGMQNEGKSCKFWKPLEMSKEGRGKWFESPGGGGGGVVQREEGGVA